MKIFIRSALAGVAAVGLACADGGKLEVGNPAPSFSLVGSDGKTHTLADYRGERTVVIAWFPKAFTGG